MIPLRDTIRSRSFPIVTWLLILANAVVFFFELSLGPRLLERFIYAFGMVPARLSLAHPWSLLTLLTATFLHGGWMHFLGNMWTLYIFGDNVEDRMGSGRFLLFYLLGGVAANLMQAWAYPNSHVPAIGASGSIAAVLGAYFLFFPHARVITLVPFFFLPWFVEIPAVFYLGVWFLTQFYSGLFALALPAQASMGGIAWWAHVGGFLFGLFLGRAFQRPQPRTWHVWYPDEYWPW